MLPRSIAAFSMTGNRKGQNMEITDKVIRKTVTVHASVEEAWTAWTTRDGLKRFFGRDNDVELRIGGKFEIYFLMNNPAGLRGSEGCTVLSFLPNRMLSFSWNAPPKYIEVRESQHKAWVVVMLGKLTGRETEVSLTHLGWPVRTEWDEVFEYFDSAWDQVLRDFKTLYDHTPPAGKDVRIV